MSSNSVQSFEGFSLIITADDFGISDDVNTAIVEALDCGYVTHASLMANMPAFEHACDLAREHGLVERVGVHLVLTQGDPLTTPIRSCGRFCDEQGQFRYWRSGDRALRLSRAESANVLGEVRAQVLRCRGCGLRAGHLDSHHHVHNKLGIAGIVIDLARELRVPRVRLAHNCGRHIGLANRIYKDWINARLRNAGLAGTRWFGSPSDYLRLQASGVPARRLESFEVNTHPGFRDGVVVDLQDGRPLEEFLTTAGTVVEVGFGGP
jgi:predicted glycoside hydrolase/deacetylase ChbG (UPF0249 family)